MTNPFIGQITIFAGNFAPRAFAFCDGQLLAISTHTALFSILGTTYGGDGRTTFALPDLRGRTPIGPRQGPGLIDWRLGAIGGSEYRILTTLNMPNHGHTASFTQTSGTVSIAAVADDANQNDPTGHYLAQPDMGGNNYMYSDATPDTTMGAGSTATVTGAVALGFTGNQQSFDILQPYNAINYIIAMQGIYPSRS